MEKYCNEIDFENPVLIQQFTMNMHMNAFFVYRLISWQCLLMMRKIKGLSKCGMSIFVFNFIWMISWMMRQNKMSSHLTKNISNKKHFLHFLDVIQWFIQSAGDFHKNCNIVLFIDESGTSVTIFYYILQ